MSSQNREPPRGPKTAGRQDSPSLEDRETAETEAPAIVGAFLKLYLEDLQAGGARSLGVYQEAFPGFEAVIAREFTRLAAGDPNTDEGEDWTTLGSGAPPLDPVDPDLRAIRIPGFELRDVLGRGGMGVVFAAEQLEPVRRSVALKVIKLGMDTREVVARFESERQALALMNHRGIAKVFDAGATPDGRPYFAMELVSGLPITQLCDEQRLRVPARLRVFLDVCEAVQHAHQRGIIHRDLKPSNVLVERREGQLEVKVIDFGIAKSTSQPLTDRSLQTQIGQIVGTPLYMSPEQAELGGLDIDTRSDVYSLGVILYELLTGYLPIGEAAASRGDYTELMRELSGEEPPLPSTRIRAAEESEDLARNRGTTRRGLKRILRGDLNWIVMKALEKDRARRYSSVSELAEDLRRHLRREAVLAGPPGVVYRLRKLVSRRRVPLALAGAALLVILATSLIWIRHERRQRDRESEEHYREALRAKQAYDRAREAIADLERALDGATAAANLPVWRRRDELRIWQELQEARRQLPALRDRVQFEFTRAESRAIPGSAPRERAADGLRAFYVELRWRARRSKSERLGPEFFDGLIRARNPAAEISKIETVQLQIDPPPDTVHCFRYEFVEGRLCPLPFDPRRGRDDPARGIVASPVLQVERIWTEEAGWKQRRPPLEAGDCVASVNGERMTGLGDLVRALESVAPGEALSLERVREGKEETVAWTPYPREDGDSAPATAAHREILRSMRRELGITFAAFPLTPEDRCRVGGALVGSRLRLPLPRGSYLLVLRKAGYADTRLPVHVPLLPDQDREVQRVRLARTEDIPQGFVPVPGGIFGFGADAERVDQSLDFGYENVESFLMKKYEVTFREYLVFLNEVASDLDPEQLREQSPSLMPRHLKGEREVELVEKLDGRWVSYQKFAPESADWPLVGLSLEAKKKYMAWLDARSGGRWHYRLPTDLEWEKAARGVDRRLYVWGDYFVPTFCATPGGREEKRPLPVGRYPHDESVYGIRDLAGSASEPTSDRISRGLISHRGGNWYTLNDYFFLVANRNGILPQNSRASDAGLRLVAERTSPAGAPSHSESGTGSGD